MKLRRAWLRLVPAMACLAFEACAVRGSVSPRFLNGLDMPGFMQATPFSVYNGRNIFDYIDGEADVYFPHGFRFLYTARIRSDDDAVLVADIYDMGTRSGAGAVFAEFSEHGKHLDGIGEMACDVNSVLIMTRGRFFARILPYSSGKRTDMAEFSRITDLARALDEVLKLE